MNLAALRFKHFCTEVEGKRSRELRTKPWKGTFGAPTAPSTGSPRPAPTPLLGCSLPSPTSQLSRSSTTPLGCCTHTGDDGAAALLPAGSPAAPGNHQLHTHLGQPCWRSSQSHPPTFYERKKIQHVHTPACSQKFANRFAEKIPPCPLTSESKLAAWKKHNHCG